jgi:hypothetical protein
VTVQEVRLQAKATYRDESFAHQLCVAERPRVSIVSCHHSLNYSLDTVERREQDQLGLGVFAHCLDVFLEVLQYLLSVLRTWLTRL